MTRFQSQKKVTNSYINNIFDFVSDLNNFKYLLPDEKVEKFQSDSKNCSFTIKGMTHMGFKLVEARQFDFIKIVDDGSAPFKFYMMFFFESINEQSTQTQVIFEADVPAMMKMMLDKPLTNFLNTINEKLETSVK
jgi:hypothetical protein